MSWLDNHFIDGNIYHIESEGQYIVADFWQPSSYAYAKITFIKCGNVKINGTNVNVSGTHDARIIIRIGYEIGMLPRMYLDFVVENNGQLLHYTDFYNNESFSFDGVYDATQSEVIGNGTITDNDYPFSKFIEGIEQVESDNIVSLRLCSYKGETHLVTKDTSTYMKNSIYMYGQLTEECDVLNPSFLIQYDDLPALNVQRTSVSPYNPLLKYNYLFVDKFKRSYFINKITSVRKGLWRIDCHVDVLNTYDSDIRKQSGSIIRSGNWHHAIGLVDDRLPLRDVPQLMVYNVPFKANSDNPLIYVQFLPENQLTDNIVISVINNQAPEDDTTKNQTTTFDTLPNVQRKNFKNTLINSYVISSSQLKTILNIIKDDDNKASFIANIIAFPFTLPSKDISYTQTIINLGDESTGVSGVLLNSNISTYLYLTDFTCDSNYFPLFTERYDNELSFLNYEPYCQCEIYLPYYGWTKLSIKDIYNQKISVYYVVDYLSGSATVNVYNNFRHTIIFSAQCQLGIEISKSTTNQREISDRKNAIGINTALSLVASAISVGVGFASSNPLAVVGGVAGGVMAGAKAIASAVNENNMLYDTAQAQFSDGNTGLLAPQRCRLKFQYRFIDAYDDSVYRHLNGYPCNRYKPLTAQSSSEDTYTGYTEVIFHYTPDTQTWITSTEISEIEELAKNGIIL